MRFLEICKDGGPESKVWAYVGIEVKSLFSIILLRFEHGSREAYHSHAFNAMSWVLSGCLVEFVKEAREVNLYRPSVRPVFTSRDTFHQVRSRGRTWVLSFRGPWSRTWREYIPAEARTVTLTHGRKEVSNGS